MVTVYGFRPARRMAGGVQRFRVQSSTVKVVKIFDFESNAEFIRALKLAE